MYIIYVCIYVYTYVHTYYVLTSSRLRPRRCVCFVVLLPKNFTSRMRIYYVFAAVFASCFYVLFKFRLVREGDQGHPLVNPFISYNFLFMMLITS